MSKLVDRLVRMTIAVSSPDGNLNATFDSERNATFELRDPDDFDPDDSSILSTQIASLLRSGNQGRQQGIRRAYESLGMEYRPTHAAHWDAAHRRFYDALAETVPEGHSHGGLLMLHATADLTDYRVTLDQEALAHTSGEEFIGELSSAYRDLLSNRRQLRAELLKKHLGE